jgi:hypothetical protein
MRICLADLLVYRLDISVGYPSLISDTYADRKAKMVKHITALAFIAGVITLILLAATADAKDCTGPNPYGKPNKCVEPTENYIYSWFTTDGRPIMVRALGSRKDDRTVYTPRSFGVV